MDCSLDQTFDEIVNSPDYYPVGSSNLWDALAHCHEHPKWDQPYHFVVRDDDYDLDWYYPEGGLPCPECGSRLDVFGGLFDQDEMGNDLYGIGWVCLQCGFEDINEVE